MSRRDIFKIALVAVVLVLAVVLTGRISNTQHTAESEIVRQSIKDAAINCYAVDIRDIFTDAENANYSETRTFEIKNPETWIATDETEIGIRPGWSKVPGIPVVNSLQLNVEGKTLNVTYDAKVR